ncbi:MAG: putative porin [Candidatus Omnitrophica bacterium]|nr:putative porin [Candidatus Omnitrophota bacterium]
MKKKSYIILAIMTGFLLLGSHPLTYAEDTQLITLVKDLQKQVMTLQKTVSEQQVKILDLEKVRVERKDVQQDIQVPEDFMVNLKESIGDSDKWLKDLKFSGDFRLRYEARDMVDSAGKATTSAMRDQNRFRYRLRYGFTKKFNPDMEVGFRMASIPGENVVPTRTTTNTTLDNQFAFKDIAIDLAYVKYTPGWAEVGPVQGLEITAGKFKNPISHQASWIIWDGDVTPEGLYEKVDVGLLKTDDLEVNLSALAGQWILEEGTALASHDDAELYLWSGNLTTKVKGILKYPIETRHHVTYYDYRDFASRLGNFGAAGNNFVNGAGTLAAEDFNIWDIYNEASFQFDERIPKLTLFQDYVENVSNHAWGGLGEEESSAWALGAKLGKAKKKGTWEVSYTYAQIEANAVPSVFTDGDFTGTNERGSVIRGSYALTDSLKLSSAAIFTNNMRGDQDAERRLFQADLIWTF